MWEEWITLNYEQLVDQYHRYKREKLNWWERLGEKLTFTDELLDFLMLTMLRHEVLLREQLACLRAITGLPPSGQVPEVGNPETFSTGQVVVVTAGTPVQLPDITVPAGCKAIIATWPDNVDDIFFASSELGARPTSTTRFDRLEPGDSFPFKIANLEEIWIDADNSGDGISWYIERMKK